MSVLGTDPRNFHQTNVEVTIPRISTNTELNKQMAQSHTADAASKVNVPGTDPGKTFLKGDSMQSQADKGQNEPDIDSGNLSPKNKNKNENINFPTETPSSDEHHVDKDKLTAHIKTSNVKTRDLKIEINKLDINVSGTVIVTVEMLEKLPSSKHDASGYDSDKTVIYFPLKDNLPKQPREVLINQGVTAPKPLKRLKGHTCLGAVLRSLFTV